MRGDKWDELRAAFKVGARRATVHVARAGLEIVAAGGAILDEVIRVRRDAPKDAEGRREWTRVDVE